MADSPDNRNIFRRVALMRISSKMGTSSPSSWSDRVLETGCPISAESVASDATDQHNSGRNINSFPDA
jgi:hypothetical protein